MRLATRCNAMSLIILTDKQNHGQIWQNSMEKRDGRSLFVTPSTCIILTAKCLTQLNKIYIC